MNRIFQAPRDLLNERGFCILPQALSPQANAAFIDAITVAAENAEYSRGGQVYALRQVFGRLPQTRELVTSPFVREIVEPILGENYFAVRGLLFDKTLDANWKVPFHQDLTIAVKEKCEAPEFGPWSVKEEVLHVQPPVEILESMLTLRFHLDDCDAQNGALRVLPGSHRRGKLSAAQIQEQRKSVPEAICEVPAGGVLLMRPLLLHASSPASTPRHRRVLHFDFASRELPHGLRWYQRICVGAEE